MLICQGRCRRRLYRRHRIRAADVQSVDYRLYGCCQEKSVGKATEVRHIVGFWLERADVPLRLYDYRGRWRHKDWMEVYSSRAHQVDELRRGVKSAVQHPWWYRLAWPAGPSLARSQLQHVRPFRWRRPYLWVGGVLSAEKAHLDIKFYIFPRLMKRYKVRQFLKNKS